MKPALVNCSLYTGMLESVTHGNRYQLSPTPVFVMMTNYVMLALPVQFC